MADALGGTGVYDYLVNARIGAATTITPATWIVVGMASLAGIMTLL